MCTDHAAPTRTHTHDYAEANRQHFNNAAQTQDFHTNELFISLANRIGEKILAAYPFDPDATVVMDFACGPGLVSQKIGRSAKKIVGVDISQGMVDLYNKRATGEGIAPEAMRAVCYELKGEPGELDGVTFDVVFCSLAYHHFTSIESTTRILISFLKPTGMLIIVDLMKTPHPHGQGTFEGPEVPEHVKHTVAHKDGWDEEDMRRLLEGAGLQGFRFESGPGFEVHGKKLESFVATAVKPSG